MGSCLCTDTRSLPGSPSSLAFGGIRKGKFSKNRPGGLRNSSFEYRKEEEESLHRIPGRIFLNGSSDVASLFTQQGKKGTNQDAMLVWENFGSHTDTVFCGIFDGHGPHGHLVSRKVRDALPLKLSANWEVTESLLGEIRLNTAGSMASENTPFMSTDEEKSREWQDVNVTEKQEPMLFQTLKESLLEAFSVMDKELKMHENMDCYCSGTTAVTLIKHGQLLVIGHVGDSRAVLGTRNKDNQLAAVQLTVDLKPNLPEEAKRIKKCKGRVFALHDEPEVARVWLPNNDAPGLAMARAFGDFCLKNCGLISVPEVSFRHLTEKDEFIVLATDGVWDVLSNEEVVDIVAYAPSRSNAARSLVESAVSAWKYKFPTSKVDDCAVVCLFLDSGSNNVTVASDSKTEEQFFPTDKLKNAILEAGDVGRNEDEDDPLKQEESDSTSGVEWSALQGVSRENTLVNLPRFVPRQDTKKDATTRKARR